MWYRDHGPDLKTTNCGLDLKVLVSVWRFWSGIFGF